MKKQISSNTEKGYFDKAWQTHDSKWYHVKSYGGISLCRWQNVEEEWLVKSLQQVVQTPTYTFYYPAIVNTYVK